MLWLELCFGSTLADYAIDEFGHGRKPKKRAVESQLGIGGQVTD